MAFFRSWNQEVEVGMAPFIIASNGPLGDFVFHISAILGSRGLEVLALKGHGKCPTKL